MIRTAFTIVASGALLAGVSAAAAPCRNAHGKFVKCPPVTHTTTTTTKTTVKRCHDANGRFTACPK